MPLYHIIVTSKHLPIDTRMDMIYDHVDTMMSLGEWAKLDEELREVIFHIKDIDLDCLLGVACSSLPGEFELSSRAEFMAKCKEMYPDENLWIGL